MSLIKIRTRTYVDSIDESLGGGGIWNHWCFYFNKSHFEQLCERGLLIRELAEREQDPHKTIMVRLRRYAVCSILEEIEFYFSRAHYQRLDLKKAGSEPVTFRTSSGKRIILNLDPEP